MGNKDQNQVKTTERSLNILEALRVLDGARLTDIADHLDLPASTVYNHLNTLADRNYVIKQGDSYHVGLQFLDYGAYARSQRFGFDSARSELSTIARETGETVSLIAEEDGISVVLYTETGEDAVPLDIRPGKRVPLHRTIAGKVILAYFSESRIQEYIDTHQTEEPEGEGITDPDELIEECEQIREEGIAYGDEDRLHGVRSVAMSIKDTRGQLLFAVAISAPTSRLDDERLPDVVETLKGAVNIIELKIAHS